MDGKLDGKKIQSDHEKRAHDSGMWFALACQARQDGAVAGDALLASLASFVAGEKLLQIAS